jgi:putative acetyltransferase
MDFVLDDLQGDDIRSLLRLHLASALQHSPPGSVHALDVDGLRRPGVTFWSCWREGELRHGRTSTSGSFSWPFAMIVYL